MTKPFKRLLLTGAAGGLGKVLRDRIKPWADVVVLSDIADLGEAREGEEIIQCDLSDKAAVMRLLEGVEAVLHFGGISTENTFENIVQANIIGTANLYEAAHKPGTKEGCASGDCGACTVVIGELHTDEQGTEGLALHYFYRAG